MICWPFLMIVFTVKVIMESGKKWQDTERPTFIKCHFCAKRIAWYLLRLQVKITEIKLMFSHLGWLFLQSINSHNSLWCRWKLNKEMSAEAQNLSPCLQDRLLTRHCHWSVYAFDHPEPPAGRNPPLIITRHRAAQWIMVWYTWHSCYRSNLNGRK